MYEPRTREQFGATNNDAQRSASWVWGAVAVPFVLFFLGGIIFNRAASEKVAVHGRAGNESGGVWVAISTWLLAVLVSGVAMAAISRFRLGKRSKTVMMIVAVLGLTLNALPLIALTLLNIVLRGPGWGR